MRVTQKCLFLICICSLFENLFLCLFGLLLAKNPQNANIPLIPVNPQSLHSSHVVGPLCASMLWFVALTGQPVYGRAPGLGQTTGPDFSCGASSICKDFQCIAATTAESSTSLPMHWLQWAHGSDRSMVNHNVACMKCFDMKRQSVLVSI